MTSATTRAADSRVNGVAAAVPWPGRSGAKQRNSSDRAAIWWAHWAPVRRVAWTNTIAGRASGSVDRLAAPPPAGTSLVAGDELPFDRVERRLRPARQAQLAQDVADVGPRRPLGDPEVRRDLLVAPTAPDERQDLELAFRERLGRRRGGPGPHALREDAGGGRVEVDLVVVGGADRGRDVVRVGVLEDEAARAGLQRRGDLLLLDEARQRDDLDLRVGDLDPADRADPVELGHHDVHQDDVGLELVHEVHALQAVLRLADDLDVVEELEIAAQA